MYITYKTIDILKQQVAETANLPAHSNLSYLILVWKQRKWIFKPSLQQNINIYNSLLLHINKSMFMPNVG